MDILIYPCHRFLFYAKENMSVSVHQDTISEVNEIHKEDEVINNLISCDQSANKTVAKIFSEYPWMSTESLTNTVIKSSKDPVDGIAGLTGKYTDILGKNPVDSIMGLTGLHADMLGKNPVESIQELTGRHTGILGKNPVDSIMGLTGKHTDMLGNNSLTGKN